MDQRISLVTLGARDPEALAAFYEALGWTRVDSPDGVIAFDLIGQTLGLYPLNKLAEDIGVPVETLGRGASTFSHNVDSADAVRALVTRAHDAGARILRDPSEVFWGGFIAYFADPEGHIWEVAHNPFSALGPNGAVRWNGYG
ncbi:VOC family protein [Sulfitobacter sp. S190]|uniref:VOC family protein n=1 Tax=Sulfitobacter sp. S190 TaxID=2867022 RepID=UPI0021A2D686|nr:VOC family protein [Sulfitobacter sp. S190]UWR21459.1 VOC family protein [Sulfitobacter sp. S190]